MTKENDMVNKKQETKATDAKSADTQQAQNYAGFQAIGNQAQYAGMPSQGQPDYYQLSYLKRPHEGAAWERLTEYFPTHDESTTRALALSAGGDTACVRTLPRYWNEIGNYK